MRSRFLGALCVLALVATACGSDDDQASETTAQQAATTTQAVETTAAATGAAADTSVLPTDTTAAEPTDPLGSPNKATGTPVKVGFYTDNGGAVDYTNMIEATNATVDWINEYGGGLGGHPIELVYCESKLAPAGATDCANELLSEDVAFVQSASVILAGVIIPVIAGAGVPMVFDTGASPIAFNTPGVFTLTNSVGSYFGGPGLIAKELGLSKISVIAVDTASTLAPYAEQVPAFYDAIGGVDLVEVIPVPPGTPDMTPNAQTALQKSPELFSVVGNAQFCSAALRALRTVGFDGPVVFNPECVETYGDEALAAIPEIEGTYLTTSANVTESDDDFALYSAIMEKYAPDTPVLNFRAAGGFQTVMSIYRVLGKTTEELTPEAVTQAFQGGSATDLPLGGDLQFQCNGSQTVYSPGTCTADSFRGIFEADGSLSSLEPLGLDAFKDVAVTGM